MRPSAEPIILISTTAKKRGYKRCNRCFTRSHVKRKYCRNCNSRFPVRRPTKSDYEACELSTASDSFRLFSVCRTLQGLPTRGFVIFNCNTSRWTCFCCRGLPCITTSGGVADGRYVGSQRENLLCEDEEVYCAHIKSCRICERLAIPLIIKSDVVTQLVPPSHAQCLFERIERKLNGSCAAVFRVHQKSFAVCCEANDFVAEVNRPEARIGFLHTYFFENKHEQATYLSDPRLKFSCQCDFFRAHSKVQLRLRGTMVRCVHYYLTVASIQSTPELVDYFEPFNLRTGMLKASYGTNATALAANTTRAHRPVTDTGEQSPFEMFNQYSLVLTYADWLMSVAERINNTLHPCNTRRTQVLAFHTCTRFMDALRDELSKIVATKVKKMRCHPTLPLGPCTEYTWSLNSMGSLRQVIADVDEIRYYQIVDEEFQPIAESDLDYNSLENRLVRCVVDFSEPFSFTWVQANRQPMLAGELTLTYAIRRDLYG